MDWSLIEIQSLGDTALIVRIPGPLDDILQAAHVLREAAIPGVVEITTSYESLGVSYDPALLHNPQAADGIETHLIAQLQGALISALPRISKTKAASRDVVIPVCYDREFALDLDDVSERAGLSAAAVVELHSAPEYRVACLGFTPGFPYLSGLPRELATPRRPVPRKAVPAGSVAIGGAQTGIYPSASPGGWNVIGCTPLRLFDPTSDPPALLAPGDRLRFRPITANEFRSFTAETTGAIRRKQIAR